jgi:hypothetical protein
MVKLSIPRRSKHSVAKGSQFDVRNFTTLNHSYEFYVNSRYLLPYKENHPHFAIEITEENIWPLRN